MGKMTIMTRPEMIDQLRRYTAQGMAPGVAVATWMESFPAEMQRNSSVNPGDANWETDGHLPVHLSVGAMKEVIREAFGGSEAKADRLFRDALGLLQDRSQTIQIRRVDQHGNAVAAPTQAGPTPKPPSPAQAEPELSL